MVICLSGCLKNPRGSPASSADSNPEQPPHTAAPTASTPDTIRIADRAVDAPAGFQPIRIIFEKPQRTEKPVHVDLLLPQNWTATVADDPSSPGVTMMYGDAEAGSIAVFPFADTSAEYPTRPDGDLENRYRWYFADVLVGNHVYGDFYQPLLQTDVREVGRCRFEYDGKFESNGEGYSRDGILSASIPLAQYARVVFAGSDLSKTQIDTTAESIVLSETA